MARPDATYAALDLGTNQLPASGGASDAPTASAWSMLFPASSGSAKASRNRAAERRRDRARASTRSPFAATR
jgi:hypothetical protein